MKESLYLDINKDKSSEKIKQISEYYKESDNEYYKEIQSRISYILNTIYMGVGKLLRKSNLQLDGESINMLLEKLKLLGIYMPINEFSYGVNRQLKMLTTVSGKIKRKSKRVKWLLKKQISNLKVNWGDITQNKEEWYEEFKRNNDKFIEEIKAVQNYIQQEIMQTLEEIEKNDINYDKYIRRIKYLYNRAEVFMIQDDYKMMVKILEYNPLVDARKLRYYSKTVETLVENIDYQGLKIIDLHKIWLMGEIESDVYVEKLVYLFKETYRQKLIYQNIIVTEALLKQNKITVDLIEFCMEEVENGNIKINEYIIVRNLLFLLNCNADKVTEIIGKVYDMYIKNNRIRLLIEWIMEHPGINILSLKKQDINYEIGDEYGEGYELLMYIDEYIS